MTDNSLKTSEANLFLFGFMKYHPLPFLESLQKGMLYCNSIQELARIDPSDGRGDKFETATSIRFDKGMTMDLRYINDTHYEFSKIDESRYQIVSRNRDENNGRLFPFNHRPSRVLEKSKKKVRRAKPAV